MIRRILVLFACLFISYNAYNQSYNYWTRSFNEESSLLSGAVVGGGAGPSAIYYNPSSISEITESKFSLHASLFSFDFFDLKNALGTDIGLKSSKALIQPRFLSYMIQPKKSQKWSFEIAFLNNENYNLELTRSVDKKIDILQELPGDERYFAMFQFLNIYRDDWFGFGGSLKISPELFFGTSLFVSVKHLEYRWNVDIEAYPLSDSVFINNNPVSFYSASYQEVEYVKFNNYRLLWNIGLLYKKSNFSFGLCIKASSINVYSEAKKNAKKEKQSNISSPYSDEFLPDYIIADYQEKKDVSVNFKDPFSIAAGFTYYSPDDKRTFFSTIEYFGGIDPYKIIEANENPDLASGTLFEDLKYHEWLSFVQGAKPVLNAAVGYRWQVREKLMIMGGFRTDFNYRKDFDYGEYSGFNIMKGLNLDLYHLTGGVNITILGQDLIAGLQYSFGNENGQKELINLSEPIEFNTIENAALQGARENNMNIFYNELSLYFGATFNFGKKKD